MTIQDVRFICQKPVSKRFNGEAAIHMEPPEETSLVVVWADRDRSGVGEAAALSLRERLIERGMPVAVHLPPTPIPAGAKGIDWADVWCGHPQRNAAWIIRG